MFRKAFPWSRDENKELPLVDEKGVKVRIREKRETDIRNEYSWRIDPELSRLDATRPMTMSYEDFFRYSREEMQFPNYRSKRLAVETLEGIHIGNIMYYDLDMRSRQAELGIMIGDKEYWSSGYGTDTVNTLLRHLFTTLELDKVYLHTLSWNYRAQASFNKSGFKSVRDVKRGGQDFILMEVLRPDWEKSQSK
ncbi:MAG: N-acetyltransferase [SAR202 cluster bacterium]|mgnify:FL=1|nr:MAG: N-acetyltransferase [SAR202 cluster bacterium]KAA1303836.1 MAG: N-acetyltransferase [SAR202 cluster bacterium]MEC7733222.1 GNAT family N-acetyltransferase [Chloroflexota bacterium]MEC8986358.1 GNAT family N-acetyltransferase [Chloroflexota bacterium]MEE3346491.1 GNAT family N-acetyltransferase [Chloroflexota bacterium]